MNELDDMLIRLRARIGARLMELEGEEPPPGSAIGPYREVQVSGRQASGIDPPEFTLLPEPGPSGPEEDRFAFPQARASTPQPGSALEFKARDGDAGETDAPDRTWAPAAPTDRLNFGGSHDPPPSAPKASTAPEHGKADRDSFAVTNAVERIFQRVASIVGWRGGGRGPSARP